MRTGRSRRASLAQQRGITLVVGLIMLVLLTLMAIAAFHMGSAQQTIVSNAQHRNEATDAAQQAIETVVNSSNFMVNPSAAIPTSNCSGGGSNTLCTDVNGDGIADIKVTLSPQPTCISGAPINASTLDFSKAEDLGCSSGIQQSFGVQGATSADSLCAQSNWEVTAVANDTATKTNVTVVQGVSARIATTDLTNNCP
jgi:Tfp pilus assembly protein PilX